MYDIEHATRDDVLTCLELAKQMHMESPVFRDLDFDDEKVCGLMLHAIAHEDHALIVAKEHGTIVGGIMGYIAPHYFGHDRAAFDFGIFVMHGHRNGRLGLQLLMHFERWAFKNHVKRIVLGVTTGINDDRVLSLYERAGYSRMGGFVMKEAK